jgi:hypothetical protein
MLLCVVRRGVANADMYLHRIKRVGQHQVAGLLWFDPDGIVDRMPKLLLASQIARVV